MVSLNPWDGGEERGINLAPGVAERAPDPNCSFPQHRRRGSAAFAAGRHGTEGMVALVLEWPRDAPKPRYKPPRGEAELLKEVPRGQADWKGCACWWAKPAALMLLVQVWQGTPRSPPVDVPRNLPAPTWSWELPPASRTIL